MPETSLDIRINPRPAQSGARAVQEALDQVKAAARSTLDLMESRFDRLKGALFNLKTAIAGLGIGLAGREIVESVRSLERMENMLKAVTGSTEGARSELLFIRREAARLGLELESTATAYARLTAASAGTALAGQQTREIFLAVAQAGAVLGLSAEDMTGTLRAIEQIMSKGTLQAEELRGQLGDRLPGAFQIAARAMGVSTAELNKMLAQGQVLAADFLPRFAAELNRTFGAGAADAMRSTQAELNRFKTALFELQTAIGRSGLVQGLVAGLRALTEAIRSPKVVEALQTVGALFGAIIEKVAQLAQQWAPFLAEAFLESFKAMLIGGARFIDFITPAFRGVLKVLQDAWENWKTLTSAVPGLAELGLFGLLALGTKGRLAVIGGLFLMDKLIKTSKEAAAFLLEKATGGKPEDIRKLLDEVEASVFGTGPQKIDKKLTLDIGPETGPVEAAVKRILKQLEDLRKKRLVPPALEPTLQPAPPERIPTKAEEEIAKARQKLELETLLAEKKLEITQLTGAHSQAVEVETKLMEIQNDLAREGASLTDEQTQAFRGLIERLVAASTATEQLADAQRDYERTLVARNRFFKEIEREIATSRELLAIQGKSRQEQEVETRIIQLKHRLREEGLSLSDQEIEKARGLFAELAKINAQIEQAQTPLGNLAQYASDVLLQLQNAAVRGFGAMEDAIVQFVKTGKFSFREFSQVVQEELLRIAIRASVTAPLAGLLNSFLGPLAGGFFSGTATTTTAGSQTFFTVSSGNLTQANRLGFTVPTFGQRHGGIMPVERFERGGIAHGPQLAIFGEGAQSEAFVPLPDGRSIPVTLRGRSDERLLVQVFNQVPGADVSAREARGPDGRQLIQVLVIPAIKQALGAGEFDREFAVNFGVTRKGVAR